jgi:4-hydroxythreonine-4-phosphate dehydrogenase
MGDPAGIGPDLLCLLAEQIKELPIVIIGDETVLQQRARELGVTTFDIDRWQPGEPVNKNRLHILHSAVKRPVHARQPDASNSDAVIHWLDLAADGCLDGTFSAMVTAPLAKNIVIEGGYRDFSGHTEYLAQRANKDRVVMMLATDQLRVALATTHLPLRQVADAINASMLEETLTILVDDLQQHFAINEPRILVLGLNPHAGESGHLGSEEQRIIEPLLEKLRRQGMKLTGPAPADTAFNQSLLSEHDAVLAMYHDQGLPVLKYAGFGKAINITLGLPFIRTSVDHGTAFDLAGTGNIDTGSMIEAISTALELAVKTEQAR